MEDPGFESCQGQGIFLFTEISTLALEPASLLFDRSFDFFTRASRERGMSLTTRRHLVLRLRISGAVTLLPLDAFMGRTGTNSHLLSAGLTKLL